MVQWCYDGRSVGLGHHRGGRVEDVDHDGKQEIIVPMDISGNSSGGGIVVLKPDGTVKSSYYWAGVSLCGGQETAMGDINGDGVRDAVLMDGCRFTSGQPKILALDLTTVPPTIIRDFSGNQGGSQCCLEVGIANGDTQLDFITGGEGASVAIFDNSGSAICSRTLAQSGTPHDLVYTSELGGGRGPVLAVTTGSFSFVSGLLVYYLDPATCNDKFPPVSESESSRGFGNGIFADIDGDSVQEHIANVGLSSSNKVAIISPESSIRDCEITNAAVEQDRTRAVDLDGNGSSEILAKGRSGLNSLIAFNGSCRLLWEFPFGTEPIGIDVYSVTIPAGLVAYYKFDEGTSGTCPSLGATAQDSSGNANHGTIQGPCYTAGKSETALDFDGQDDYVEMPTFESGNRFTAYTIEVWINLDDVTRSEQDVVTFLANNGEFNFAVYNDDAVCAQSNTAGPFGASAVDAVVTNKWYHIVCTWDGTNLRAYLNGQLRATTPVSELLPSGTCCSNRIGKRAFYSSIAPTDGRIDEVKIWKRALSDAEVLAECQEFAAPDVICDSPPSGKIIVEKQTDPNPDTTNTSFNFTAAGGLNPTNFSLKNGEMKMFENVPTGSGYSISETVPPGWDLTSATCDDGSPVTNINVSAGETVTCTFTNTKRGTIIVKKVTNPNPDTTDTDFSFTASGGLSPTSFNLKNGEMQTFADVTPTSGYSIAETVPAGWDLASATCVSSINDSETPGNIELDAGETVTCTFNNTKRGHIIVDKVTNPSNDPQSFNFDANGGSYADFSLTDTATPNSQSLVPGAYSVSETVPGGWDLTDLVCLSTLGISTTNTTNPPLVSIALAAGDMVTCTFTNGKPVISPATKEASNEATGSLTVFKPDDTIKYTVILSNTGGSALLDGPGDEFTDTIIAAGVLLNDFPTASSGMITYNATTRTYSWNGAIPAGGSVTLTFKVKIMKGIENGTRICNQGSAKKNNNGDTVLTSDPTPLTGAPGTQTCIEVNPGLPDRIIFCGLACILSTSDLKGKQVAIQVFNLSGKKVYSSGWTNPGDEKRLTHIEQRMANGVYLYLLNVKSADGKTIKTQVKKLIVRR